MPVNELPIPPHFNPQSVGEVWKVPYQERAEDAEGWAGQHKLQPASRDTLKISLLLVDVQNTFCIPGFELYVGGTSGTGAVDDNRRLCDFIYRNLNVITEICPTMDTHQAMQIFHGIARLNQPDFQEKGGNPLTENYSVLSPEVLTGPAGEGIAEKNAGFIYKLLHFDAVIIAGQVKSHCVAWTIDDLLNEIHISDRKLAEKVYLLEDCTSAVVIPDVIDYTESADEAFQKFADAGMHIVRSTDPIVSWPGLKL